ncbi:sugar ABC transporter permease [Sorangium cellulosum]|uniref:Sugar ABC transporter permease n=1 Tax=Sorangium cellulosum TaxID=56 RepID=A0A150PNU7_SORCE|nr:sugar ABC transporter permease [Sorangium cellulosum]
MRSLDRRDVPLVATAVLLVALYAGVLVGYESARSLRFLVDLIKGNAAMGICAVGMTFVILSGGIDLSVGSVVALTTVLVGTLVTSGCHPLLAFCVGLAVAVSFGAVTGYLIHEFSLPPFLVTLAGMFFARGAAFLVSMQPIAVDHPALDWIVDEVGFTAMIPGLGRTWVPATALLFLIVFALGVVLHRSTSFGRNVLAMGGDRQASLLMGVPLGATTVALYALSGLCAGLGGVTTALIDSAGKPNIGAGLELEAIASVVIGGTLLTGGAGSVVGTMMGVMITGIVRAVINLDGRLPSPWHHISIGLLLLGFIVMQQLLIRSAPAARGDEARSHR